MSAKGWTLILSFSLVTMVAAQTSQTQTAREGSNNVQIGTARDVSIRQEIKHYSPGQEPLNFVPESYLNKLVEVRQSALEAAHKLWDTGVTSKMKEGNALFADRLLPFVEQLVALAFPTSRLKGLTPKQYCKRLIDANSRLYWAELEARDPTLKGTADVMLAGAAQYEAMEDLIVRIAKEVSSEPFFEEWKEKWDDAKASE